ncbi:hypothetical protein VTO42DRAFT_3654 [Malbranchea cinnamomea]
MVIEVPAPLENKIPPDVETVKNPLSPIPTSWWLSSCIATGFCVMAEFCSRCVSANWEGLQHQGGIRHSATSRTPYQRLWLERDFVNVCVAHDDQVVPGLS